LTTDPTVSAGNKIYFTTSEPTSDPCGYGGQSRVWGLNCATGGALSDSCNGYGITDTSGTLYLQTSTGAIYQISTFNGKTTAELPGMPPENSLPVVPPTTTPNQSGQLIQWIER
jgi:type IV pilus assembly protein PilY1